MSGIDLFAFGVMCLSIGIAIGAWWTWHNWLRSEKPVYHITVDKDVASQLSEAMVMVWLDQHGLTWQPKGAVFSLGKGVKK